MKKQMAVVLCLTTVLGAMGMAPRGDPTVPGELTIHATIQSIGIVAPYTGDDNQNNIASIRYRPAGASTWLAGHEMFVDRSARQWRGSLVYLSPETQYEVQVQFTDPDGVSPSSMSGTVTTRPDYPDVGGGGNIRYVPDDGSLQTVIDASSPGDTIRIRDGVYYTSAVLGVEDSGAAGNYLTIEADPGAHVVLDGSDPEINDPLADNWTRYSSDSNIYYTDLAWGDRTCNGKYTVPNYVGEQRSGDGVRFLLYLDTGEWNEFVDAPVGKALYDCNGPHRGRLYVVTYEGDDPDNHEIHVSRYPIGLALIGADYVRIRDLEFRYYSVYNLQLGRSYIANKGANDNIIEGNTFHGSKFSLFVGEWDERSSADNLIQNNYFYELGYRDSRWTWEQYYDHASSTAVALIFAGSGNVVRRNHVKSGTDGIDVDFQSHDTDVYENVIEECVDDGMEVDSEPGYNIRVWGNTIRYCYSGISNQDWFRGYYWNTGPIYIFRNVIAGGPDPYNRTDSTGKVYYTGYAFKVGANRAGTGRAYYYHNTISITSPASVFLGNGIQDAGGSYFSGVVGRNNIWKVGWKVFDLNLSTTAVGHDMDCDNLYNPGTSSDSNFVQWSSSGGPSGNGIYRDLSSFRSYTGQEPHGISNNNTKLNADYTLQPASPEIDAGCLITGFNDRGPYAFKGSKPDMGAFEYSNSSNLGASTKTASSWTASTGASVTYTIRIVNTGEPLTSIVLMTDTLPAGVEYLTDTLTYTPGFAWVSPGSTVYWQGDISDPSSAEIRFQVLVTAAETEALVNTAEIDDGRGSVIRRSAIVNGLPVYLPVVLRN